MKIKGKVWKFGDNIDTDAIIPARYLNTSDPAELAKHVMEDADKDFPSKVKPGDIIIGGRNFGCGSSREHAPIAIKAAGVQAVVAKSYARIFFRNAFNIGLPIFEVPELVDETDEGDKIEIDMNSGEILNLTKGKKYHTKPIPEFMQELINAGGLVEWTKKRLNREGIK
ncbi:3-isopropylmalate dehydratase small subunit [Thermodesulfovibrio hydrogeniphilus]